MSEPYSPPRAQGSSAQANNQPMKGNGFGTTALVLGIVAVVFAIIPVLGTVAFILGPLAIIFGGIGLTRKLTKKGTSITGLILGAVAIIVAIIVTSLVAAAANGVNDALNKEHKIEYVVTTTGPAKVTYWNGNGSSNEDIAANWKKDLTAKGISFSTLSVTGDFSAATSVTCEILVDGASVSKNSGSGTGAMASCSGNSSAK